MCWLRAGAGAGRREGGKVIDMIQHHISMGVQSCVWPVMQWVHDRNGALSLSLW